MKNPLSLIVAVALLLASAPRLLARDAFNGTWKVTISPADDDAGKNGAKEFKDTLTFKGSQFRSAELEKKGFKATPYDEDTRGGVAATFKCEMKNEKEKTKAVWSGMSTGSDISGELTVTKPNGDELKYTWKGEKAQ